LGGIFFGPVAGLFGGVGAGGGLVTPIWIVDGVGA
jgi:hypothetical protein